MQERRSRQVGRDIWNKGSELLLPMVKVDRQNHDCFRATPASRLAAIGYLAIGIGGENVVVHPHARSRRPSGERGNCRRRENIMLAMDHDRPMTGPIVGRLRAGHQGPLSRGVQAEQPRGR